MKRLLIILLAVALLFSLAACGIVNPVGNEPSAPPDGWAAEYTILVGGSDEWTPFSGKSDVTFANSDDKVIDVSDNGKTIEFTGKKVGEAIITATLDGTESKVLVRVRAAESGEDLLKLKQPKTLYVKYLPPDFLYESEGVTFPGTPCETYYTGGEYELIYSDGRSGEARTWIDYGSESLSQYYWYDFDIEEYHWSEGGPGWGDRSGSYDGDDVVGGRELGSYWGEENNPGGMVFNPINAFALAVFRAKGTLTDVSVKEYRTNKHETILGVNCDVFEIKGATFYVDPKNHYTLKVVNEEGAVTEVLEYDVNYSGGVPYASGQEVSID
jgi:hypothetical protein